MKEYNADLVLNEIASPGMFSTLFCLKKDEEDVRAILADLVDVNLPKLTTLAEYETFTKEKVNHSGKSMLIQDFGIRPLDEEWEKIMETEDALYRTCSLKQLFSNLIPTLTANKQSLISLVVVDDSITNIEEYAHMVRYDTSIVAFLPCFSGHITPTAVRGYRWRHGPVGITLPF